MLEHRVSFLMDLDEFCNSIKKQYPEISNKADIKYDKYWSRLVEMEFSSYSWFEQLANAVNDEMAKEIPPEKYTSLMNYIGDEYNVGIAEVKNAIDVAFTENLFWQIPACKALPYWEKLPKNLQALYIGFHRYAPL